MTSFSNLPDYIDSGAGGVKRLTSTRVQLALVFGNATIYINHANRYYQGASHAIQSDFEVIEIVQTACTNSAVRTRLRDSGKPALLWPRFGR